MLILNTIMQNLSKSIIYWKIQADHTRYCVSIMSEYNWITFISSEKISRTHLERPLERTKVWTPGKKSRRHGGRNLMNPHPGRTYFQRWWIPCLVRISELLFKGTQGETVSCSAGFRNMRPVVFEIHVDPVIEIKH